MKKIIISFLSVVFMASCVTTQVNQINKYSKITVENVKNTCDLEENWKGEILGVTTQIVRFNNCLGVRTLVAVLVDIDTSTKEIRNSSANLILNHFVEYLKRDKAAKILAVKKVKEEKNDIWATFFYEITFQETRDKK